MITRCYLEITNICNLDCLFCPKTERKLGKLTAEQYDAILKKISGEVKFLYFHLMGEPLLHPLLPEFIEKARGKGFIPILTTNGTLLEKAEPIIDALPHKVQISLHSHEGNGKENPEKYMHDVMTFSKKAAEKGIIIVLRLWNQGGYDSGNEEILRLAAEYIPQPWTKRYDGWKLAENVYLEYDNMFEWPNGEKEEHREEEVFCYALRNQIGILVDGTVVPCCLDSAGNIPLGNIFTNTLSEILSSPRAVAMFNGFSRHKAVEPLCRRCGYAAVTKRFRKE